MADDLTTSASPYLRQHASDPVDWQVWGPKAFEEARSSRRPIFLSSGYSACHWCHVMQAESFRDPAIAAILNERFVPVKLDRELRPDVDAVYMDYVVAITGGGGWPMSVFLSPDLVPLSAGTYFPPERRDDMPSFRDVLDAVHEAWTRGGEDLDAAQAEGLEFLRERSQPGTPGTIDRDALDYSADYLLQYADVANGGFGTSAKFPQAPNIEFLVTYYRLNPDIGVVQTVEKAMLSMLRGGVYEQVGGGVHRYAVDPAWRLPHFEKMLYDQGLLLSSLAAAATIASSDEIRAEYARVARHTTAFLEREMTADGGGFLAALSADTEGDEGATYLWTLDELSGVLDEDELRLAAEHLGADTGDPSEEFTLIRREGDADPAAVDAVLAKLAAVRVRRAQPDADTKVLTSWNALAARGLMDAGQVFDDPAMTALGLDALRSVTGAATREGGLVHERSDASVTDVRLVEDHALIASACLTAAQVTGDETWLRRAEELHATTLRLFADGDVVYATPAETELPVRPREQGDLPAPSGAATAAENAVRLASATGDADNLAFARGVVSRQWALVDFAPEHAGRTLAVATLLEMLGE